MRPNTFLYEIARWSAAVAAVISLIWMFGGNTVSNADPVEVAEAVVETIDMENMLEADNQLIKRFYGLDPASFEGYGVEQFELLTNNAVIEVRGNFILFIVNADSAEAQKAFLKAI